MLMVTEDMDMDFAHWFGPSRLQYAIEMDRQHGAGSYLSYAKWQDLEDRLGPTGRCPTHGTQAVIRSYSTRGPDPYEVQVLDCGDHVMGLGPNDDYIVKSEFRVRCDLGLHDVSKDAYRCAACGRELCEICQSGDHSTGEGHDLNNPRYWGV